MVVCLLERADARHVVNRIVHVVILLVLLFSEQRELWQRWLRIYTFLASRIYTAVDCAFLFVGQRLLVHVKAVLNIRHLLHSALALTPATAFPGLQHERGLRIGLLSLLLVAVLSMRDYESMHALHSGRSRDVHLRVLLVLIFLFLVVFILFVARVGEAICSWSFIAATYPVILRATHFANHARLVPLAEDAAGRHWNLKLYHLARLPRLSVLVAEATLLKAFVVSIKC